MSMRKIREVLRPTHDLRLSVREVSEATGVGKTAVSEYVRRAKVVGLTWPIPPEISDAALERCLFTPTSPPPQGAQLGHSRSIRFEVLTLLNTEWEKHAHHLEVFRLHRLLV